MSKKQFKKLDEIFPRPGGSNSAVKEVLVYACMAPTDTFADNFTFESAELDWTPGNLGSHWEILYGEDGFDPETEGALLENVSQRPYRLYGLESAIACSDKTILLSFARDNGAEAWIICTPERLLSSNWTTTQHCNISMSAQKHRSPLMNGLFYQHAHSLFKTNSIA